MSCDLPALALIDQPIAIDMLGPPGLTGSTRLETSVLELVTDSQSALLRRLITGVHKSLQESKKCLY